MNTDSTIRQIEFELEKAEHGMGMPYDAERVGQLRKMLVEARKRKLSEPCEATTSQHDQAVIRRSPEMPLTVIFIGAR
jgi:hypothetical protein